MEPVWLVRGPGLAGGTPQEAGDEGGTFLKAGDQGETPQEAASDDAISLATGLVPGGCLLTPVQSLSWRDC